MSQKLCLKWNNHIKIMDDFKDFLWTETMVDVTLACEGQRLKAHKVILSACSPYFRSLFLENPCKHPIVILHDVKYSDLKGIIEFMYYGEVNIAEDNLSTLIKVAQLLKLKGLGEVNCENNESDDECKNQSDKESKSSSHEHGQELCKLQADIPLTERFTDSPPLLKQSLTTNNFSKQSLQPTVSSSLKLSHSSADYSSNSIPALSAQESSDALKVHEQQLETVAELSQGDQLQKELVLKNVKKKTILRPRNVQKKEVNNTHNSKLNNVSKQVGNSENSTSDLKQNTSKSCSTSLENFNSHMRNKHQNGQFKCNQCNYVSNVKYSFQRHLASAHPSHCCHLCPKKFLRPASLKRHIQTVHQGVHPPFKCDYCDFRAALKSYVERHMISVHKMKIFACPVCIYRSTVKEDVNRHLKERHGKIE